MLVPFVVVVRRTRLILTFTFTTVVVVVTFVIILHLPLIYVVPIRYVTIPTTVGVLFYDSTLRLHTGDSVPSLPSLYFPIYVTLHRFHHLISPLNLGVMLPYTRLLFVDLQYIDLYIAFAVVVVTAFLRWCCHSVPVLRCSFHVVLTPS